MTQVVRLAFLLAALALTAGAHPMGNFSVSHYARFNAQPERLNLTYALDLAEIPTFELMQNWNLDGKDRDAVRARAAADARRWLSGLRLLCDGRPVAIQFENAAAMVSDGAGGMPVLRIVIDAAVSLGGGSFEYEDANYPGRSGWKEIVIVGGDGAGLEAASHGSGDRSRALTEYPAGEIAAPPQELEAAFRWTPLHAAHAPRPGGAAPVSQPAARVQAGAAPAVSQEPPKPQAAPGGTVKGDYLSGMLGRREVTPWMLFVGLCVAFGLGAMHAMSPGHGKTIVAAYLVGSRGTIKHALLLGGLVTFTHTASVFVLGFAVLAFETQVVPEKVFPVLGAISGLSIVAVGASLLYRRARALRSGGDAVHHHHHHDHDAHHHHDHDHGDHHHHDHGHYHHDHDHAHGHSHVPEGPITTGSLIALGVSGGLVPCPSALVLLLSSIALGRVALGLGLLVAFSTGLAMVLMGIGVAVLYAKHLIPEGATLTNPVFRYLPVFSAAVVTVLGLLMTGVALGWIRPGGLIG